MGLSIFQGKFDLLTRHENIVWSCEGLMMGLTKWGWVDVEMIKWLQVLDGFSNKLVYLPIFRNPCIEYSDSLQVPEGKKPFLLHFSIISFWMVHSNHLFTLFFISFCLFLCQIQKNELKMRMATMNNPILAKCRF